MRKSNYKPGDEDPLIENHKYEWLTCLETYESEKLPNIDEWELIASDYETAVYENKKEEEVIIGFRGTDQPKDLYDDYLIASGNVFPRAIEGFDIVESWMKKKPESGISLTGHSLGGAIAREVGKMLLNKMPINRKLVEKESVATKGKKRLKVVTFNAAAPASSPVVTSKGETDYHIMYDLISAWQSPSTIRIDKGTRPKLTPFESYIPYMWLWKTWENILPAHSLIMFSKEVKGVIVDPQTENAEIQNWFKSLPSGAKQMVLNKLVKNVLNEGIPLIK